MVRAGNPVQVPPSRRRVLAQTSGVAAAAPFAPTDIADLRLWLKADALTLNDGDPVVTWADSSGNGFDFTQATGAKQPLYRTNIVNGKPVVRFDGTDDILVRAGIDISSATQGTLLVVFARDEVTATKQLFSSADEATATSYCSPGDQNTTRVRAVQQNAGDTADAVRSGTGVIAASTFYVLVMRSTGTAYTCWVNGTSRALTATGGADTGDWFGDTTLRDNFTVGGKKSTTELELLDGDIACVILYDRSLPDPERDQLETFAGTEYGITVA